MTVMVFVIVVSLILFQICLYSFFGDLKVVSIERELF